MTIIYITGLSGVGKSRVLEHLALEGYNVIDTDYGYTKKVFNGSYEESVLDEAKILNLIEINKESNLFISGCYSNQGQFYQYFDHVVLLTAELDVMLERIKMRTNNPYGKSIEERAEVIDSHEHVLPLLKRRASRIIDTTNTEVEYVCDRLKELLKS